MADNTILNLGVGGDNYAADEVAGVKYQRTKWTLGDDGVNEGDVSSTNPVPMRLRSNTGTTSSVTSSAANQTFLAANAARKGVQIVNESVATLFVKNATGASSLTSYSVAVPAGAYLEIPFGYTGLISGIWASASGFARITELT